MKIFISIFILTICVSAFGQKTVNLTKQYPGITSFQLKEVKPQRNFERNFIHHANESTGSNILSTELFPKPLTHSIQKAFNYYNSLKKPVDYSGFRMMGYSTIPNKALITDAPRESVRFFPANIKD
jgi:hypothetical protein